MYLFFLFQNPWPAKFRVVISYRGTNTVLVRHYEIKHECSVVEIKANGDIWPKRFDFSQKDLAANQGTIMEFNFNTRKKIWKRAKNSHFLPDSFHISPNPTEFWAKEEIVVQNSLLCCLVCKTM